MEMYNFKENKDNVNSVDLTNLDAERKICTVEIRAHEFKYCACASLTPDTLVRKFSPVEPNYIHEIAFPQIIYYHLHK